MEEVPCIAMEWLEKIALHTPGPFGSNSRPVAKPEILTHLGTQRCGTLAVPLRYPCGAWQ